jgi:hypothetical protein
MKCLFNVAINCYDYVASVVEDVTWGIGGNDDRGKTELAESQSQCPAVSDTNQTQVTAAMNLKSLHPTTVLGAAKYATRSNLMHSKLEFPVFILSKAFVRNFASALCGR